MFGGILRSSGSGHVVHNVEQPVEAFRFFLYCYQVVSHAARIHCGCRFKEPLDSGAVNTRVAHPSEMGAQHFRVG
jgi:hypothetical protein